MRRICSRREQPQHKARSCPTNWDPPEANDMSVANRGLVPECAWIFISLLEAG
jgi:hypothetical protein